MVRCSEWLLPALSFANPNCVIFDEATSSLDDHSEALIKQTIFSLREQMTTVSIAHHLATVEGSSLVLWLEQGGICMQGTADEVLPSYRRFLSSPEVVNDELARKNG